MNVKTRTVATSKKQHEKPFRVVFVGFSYTINLYQAKLAALLEIGGLEISLLCPASWKFPQWNRVFNLEKIVQGVHYYAAKHVFFGGRVGAYFYPPGIVLKLLKEFHPEAIYVEQEVFSLSAFQFACMSRLFDIPLVLFCWENMDRRLSIIRRWTRSFVLRTAKMITVGNRDAGKLIKKWGFNGTIAVLPQLGVDTGVFHPQAMRNNQNDFVVGFVGRLVPEKGVDLILQAIKTLIEQGFDCRLTICGTGASEAEVRRLAENLDISHSLVWLGEVRHEDIPEVISNIDCLVLPSRTVPGTWREQFGHVLIEAMAMGIPVIGSSSGAIPEVIGRSDLIFPEGDSNTLARLIERLMSDKGYYEEIARYGMDRVSLHYTHEAVAHRLAACFEIVRQN